MVFILWYILDAFENLMERTYSTPVYTTEFHLSGWTSSSRAEKLLQKRPLGRQCLLATLTVKT